MSVKTLWYLILTHSRMWWQILWSWEILQLCMKRHSMMC